MVTKTKQQTESIKKIDEKKVQEKKDWMLNVKMTPNERVVFTKWADYERRSVGSFLVKCAIDKVRILEQNTQPEAIIK